MIYSPDDLTYIGKIIKSAPTEHVIALADRMQRNVPYFELFTYGMRYLPEIRDKKTGKIDLDKLDTYNPEIVGYFEILSELPSLPKKLKDIATDFAIYANGESVQIDASYFKLNPVAALEKALEEIER
jgi:hypothetical protein